MVRAFARFVVGALVASAGLAACKKSAKQTELASTATAPSAFKASVLASGAPSSTPGTPTVVAGEPLSELDPCLVGGWRSTQVKMKAGQLNAEGGAKALLTISSLGIAAIDFTPMEPISAKMPEFTLNFRYGGRALATLKTPRRNALEVTRPVYTMVTVSAGAKPEHGEAVVIFENKQLLPPPAASGAQDPHAGLAARAGAAGPKGSAAPALSGNAALPGFAGIAESPAFSASNYSCADSALTLYGKDQEVSWRFVKTDLLVPVPPHY